LYCYIVGSRDSPSNYEKGRKEEGGVEIKREEGARLHEIEEFM